MLLAVTVDVYVKLSSISVLGTVLKVETVAVLVEVLVESICVEVTVNVPATKPVEVTVV